jgi:hypothetical protein
VNEVYVIVEEWLPTGDGQELHEIVDGLFYASKEAAHDELYRLAGLHNVELEEHEMAFDVPLPKSGLSSHIYYMEMLTHG